MAKPVAVAAQAPVHSPPSTGAAYSRPLGDMAIVLALTLAAALVAWRFELSETVFHWTRTREHYQLDELPGVALAFSLLMLWFARRRFEESRLALRKHDLAERQLAHLLEENRRLARQTIDVQENERRNLARELHDEMGQYLNAIKIDAVSMQRQAGREAGSSQASMDAVVRNVDHVYRVINDMIRRLRPAGLDELGLAAAIENCIDDWRARLPSLAFALEIDGDVSTLDEQLSLTLYRMIQEGLTNVARHADASRVDIRLSRRRNASGGEEIMLSVRDDGRGLAAPAAAKRPGLGLIGMRERVQALGGSLEAPDPSHDSGFGIAARIPLRKG